jgi:t-SNARE complex subunit (syntaxin)
MLSHTTISSVHRHLESAIRLLTKRDDTEAEPLRQHIRAARSLAVDLSYQRQLQERSQARGNMKNIYKTGQSGFFVRMQRNGKTISRFFSYAKHGKNALAQAQAWRDQTDPRCQKP